MGMFDYVNYDCACPICHSKVDGFQSKDGECVLDNLEPGEVDLFYAPCSKCGCWLEFSNEKKTNDEFIMTVHDYNKKDILIQSPKSVTIKDKYTSTDSIDKLIHAKIVAGMRPLQGDIRQGIRELMQDHAKTVAEALLLASHHHCMNGIGEIRMINNYELVPTNFKSVDEVVADALFERAEAESS